jgi:hypothetical protein
MHAEWPQLILQAPDQNETVRCIFSTASGWDSYLKHTFANSTTSSVVDMGTALFSKWTVTTMNARWFGEVHAFVAKLRPPLRAYDKSRSAHDQNDQN